MFIKRCFSLVVSVNILSLSQFNRHYPLFSKTYPDFNYHLNNKLYTR